MLQKLRTVTEIQLGVSHEKIEIDPVGQPKSAKKFWGKQKFVSIDNNKVQQCKINNLSWLVIFQLKTIVVFTHDNFISCLFFWTYLYSMFQ